jgi:hypothetical protein
MSWPRYASRTCRPASKGQLVAPAGKGSKYSVVPLNADACKALSDCLDGCAKSTSDRLFLGRRSQGLSPRPVKKTVLKYAQAYARLKPMCMTIVPCAVETEAPPARADAAWSEIHRAPLA